jgi:uncharacterized delta-60 repeat protein
MGGVSSVTTWRAQGTSHQRSSGGNFSREGSPPAATYWTKSYGGNWYDMGSCIRETVDGGYVVAGYTSSFGASGYDFWVLRLDSNGSITWQKTYGGSSSEYAYSIQQTSDGGFVVAGYTSSFGASGYDFWVLRLDSNGSVIWQRTYGGLNDDEAYSIQQTSDGGFVVTGLTMSFGAWYADFWLLKLNSSGDIAWQKTYGGTNWDAAYCVEQTSDGGYVVAGTTASFGAGGYDFWVLRLDSNGSVTWQNTYGGSGSDEAYSIQQTSDEGYVVCGSTSSFGAGGYDFWVLRFNSTGGITWQKTYGGFNDDEAYSIQQTSDGGFIVAGYATSFDAGRSYVWALKLNSTGSVTWQKMYRGSVGAYWNSVEETSDGGYILVGSVFDFGLPASDVWVLKLGVDGYVVWCQPTTVVPSDSGAATSATSVSSANSVATVKDTNVAPVDTNITGVVRVPQLPPMPWIGYPVDVTYTIGETGNFIVWYASSEMPSMYVITEGGTIVGSGIWRGGAIALSVDGLSVDEFMYTCTVNDTVGRSAYATVYVSVLPLAPIIDQPTSLTYMEGKRGNTIIWQPSSQIPDHYTISVNGGLLVWLNWNGGAISCNLDGWSVGRYNVTCVVYDTVGRSASSTVTVTVETDVVSRTLTIVGSCLATVLVTVFSALLLKRAQLRSQRQM